MFQTMKITALTPIILLFAAIAHGQSKSIFDTSLTGKDIHLFIKEAPIGQHDRTWTIPEGWGMNGTWSDMPANGDFVILRFNNQDYQNFGPIVVRYVPDTFFVAIGDKLYYSVNGGDLKKK